MVFSQTSHKTQSILKVVDLDRLTSNKEQQANSKNGGVIAGGETRPMPSSPAPTTSYSEVRQTSAREYVNIVTYYLVIKLK